jgi:hypothetical protein
MKHWTKVLKRLYILYSYYVVRGGIIYRIVLESLVLILKIPEGVLLSHKYWTLSELYSNLSFIPRVFEVSPKHAISRIVSVKPSWAIDASRPKCMFQSPVHIHAPPRTEKRLARYRILQDLVKLRVKFRVGRPRRKIYTVILRIILCLISLQLRGLAMCCFYMLYNVFS